MASKRRGTSCPCAPPRRHRRELDPDVKLFMRELAVSTKKCVCVSTKKNPYNLRKPNKKARKNYDGLPSMDSRSKSKTCGKDMDHGCHGSCPHAKGAAVGNIDPSCINNPTKNVIYGPPSCSRGPQSPYPCEIIMKKPLKVIRHANEDSDTSLVRIPSPVISNSVIREVGDGDDFEDGPMATAANYGERRGDGGGGGSADGGAPEGRNTCRNNCSASYKRRRYKPRQLQVYRYRLENKRRSKARKKKAIPVENICGLDEADKEDLTIPANVAKGTFQSHSLTVMPCSKDMKPLQFGILQGSTSIYNPKYAADSRGKQSLTCCIMSYCLAFHYHPRMWTIRLLDSLVDCGDQWHNQLMERLHDHRKVRGICEVIPFGTKQNLLLNGKRMQILLNEPDIIGYTMSNDPTVYNLAKGLRVFFKEHRAGVLLTRVLKLMIWKDKVCYFVFDPAGRDDKALSNYVKGSAALINVQDMDSLVGVLLGRSIIDDQKYALAAVKVLKMIDEDADVEFDSEPEMTPKQKAAAGFHVMNENYAVMSADFHLGADFFGEARFKQALPIAVVALAYSKISPANTWYSRTLNKILKLGNKLYVDCYEPKALVDLTIDNLPIEIVLGPYLCEIIIFRDKVKGQLFPAKDCYLSINTGMEEFFQKNFNSGLLQFDAYTFAVWRQHGMYYMFDPYPRSPEGFKCLNGRASFLMLANPNMIGEVIRYNFEHFPPFTPFTIHAFKLLKLKKNDPKDKIVCTLSKSDIKIKKKSVPDPTGKKPATPLFGGGGERYHNTVPIVSMKVEQPGGVDENAYDVEMMGDILSLVESLHDEYVPPQAKVKQPTVIVNVARIVNLDSPSVSATQLVPSWPAPSDKRDVPADKDPSLTPTLKGEGGGTSAPNTAAMSDAESAPPSRPPPGSPEEPPAQETVAPPPPPSPPGNLEPQPKEDEAIKPVERKVLLPVDFEVRHMQHVDMRCSLTCSQYAFSADSLESGSMPNARPKANPNFIGMPDGSEHVRGTTGIINDKANDIMPFGSIMAIIVSYKYNIATWTPEIVDFVVEAGKLLHRKKVERFSFAPIHIIPRITVGVHSFQTTILVCGEGPTWKLEPILCKFFEQYDRGMITTQQFSGAIFRRGEFYYLFDPGPCNHVGLRDCTGNACFARFRTPKALAQRIMFNKEGLLEHQQFIMSRIIVKKIISSSPADPLSTANVAPDPDANQPQSAISTGSGYHWLEGYYRIEGTTALLERSTSPGVKVCHFVCVMAMLTLALHPVQTWTYHYVDLALEKGLEIYQRACNTMLADKRIIRNICIEDHIFNLNVRRVIVINENKVKMLEQYTKAVMKKLRFVIIRFPNCSLVIHESGGFFHLFDPYPTPAPYLSGNKNEAKKASPVASWILFKTIESLNEHLRKVVLSFDVNEPQFYTYELTSIKRIPKCMAFSYKVGPRFRPEICPNEEFMKRVKPMPVVDEKLYWLDVPRIPWSRTSGVNGAGMMRGTAQTTWREFDIELPGDLFSIWGQDLSLHMEMFARERRGKQVVVACAIALGMAEVYDPSEWNSIILDKIIMAADEYYADYFEDADRPIEPTDIKYGLFLSPLNFNFNFHHAETGHVYEMNIEKHNLSRALRKVFASNDKQGFLMCAGKCYAFGKIRNSYYLYDAQSYGTPVYPPGSGTSYLLKCESMNRLLFCIILLLNVHRHGVPFDIFTGPVNITFSTVDDKKNKSKSPDKGKAKKDKSKKKGKDKRKDKGKGKNTDCSKSNSSVSSKGSK